ncbi:MULTISPECIES: glycosyltransferase family A protein [Chryseobacterium]|uniref:Putative glycosyltransferase EpsJ n=1 Tax=Chryseobacterium salivictor TaxID=2547600 RepID=A0A4P6ZGI7_9FLAO|nr:MULTISPECIES: glycosyltransferase family A protein [Chryseobacterium]MDQ0477661.1 glycosyltransferase involved in cell wall biosynthesis [Chryseobacterium sp. MDT2-18]QBO58846.1 putative glycosyltransferase EpsJ [Chryseobacterium salivictor]
MISVIIPVYNCEKSIEKTFISIKNQTWKGDFEIIVVNDGATDGSKNVIESYRRKNPDQDIILINQENGGVSKARNTAMKIAKGDYIALLDSDDEWLPEKIERQMEFLENKDFNIDFLGTRRINHQLLYPYKVDENNLSEITFRRLMLRNETQPSTVIFKRKVLQNSGLFDADQRYAEDLNYWLRISENNKMYILNEELLFAGSGKRSFGISGLSANLEAMEKGFQKNLKEMLLQNRIRCTEYALYVVFYKLKYVIRINRNAYLKLKGR